MTTMNSTAEIAAAQIVDAFVDAIESWKATAYLYPELGRQFADTFHAGIRYKNGVWTAEVDFREVDYPDMTISFTGYPRTAKSIFDLSDSGLKTLRELALDHLYQIGWEG